MLLVLRTRWENKAETYSPAGHKQEHFHFVFFLYLSPHFYRIVEENERCTRKQELILLVKTVLRDYLGTMAHFDNGQCRQLHTTARFGSPVNL